MLTSNYFREMPSMDTAITIHLFRGTPQYGGVSVESFQALHDIVKKIYSERVIHACDGHEFVPRAWKDSDLLIFPGGKCSSWDEIISNDSLDQLMDWFKKGGRIWAVCAGSYYCSKKSKYYDLCKLRKISLFSGLCEGPALSEDIKVVKVKWVRDNTEGYVAIIGGGVFIPKEKKKNKYEVLATYEGQAVVLRCEKEKGVGILSTLHWEFNSEHLEVLRSNPEREKDIIEMQKLLVDSKGFRKHCLEYMLGCLVYV